MLRLHHHKAAGDWRAVGEGIDAKAATLLDAVLAAKKLARERYAEDDTRLVEIIRPDGSVAGVYGRWYGGVNLFDDREQRLLVKQQRGKR